MDSITVVLLIFFGVYVLARMATIAEESKRRAIMAEIERDRRRRLEALYGREDEEGM